MKIGCQKCGATYAIDDKFITAKGVRAQCPKCKNLQLVKKDAAPAGDLPPVMSPPDPFPQLDKPSATRPPVPSVSRAVAPARAPAPAAMPVPPPGDFLFDLPPPSSGSGPPPAPLPSPSSSKPKPGQELDFGELNDLLPAPQVTPSKPNRAPVSAPASDSHAQQANFGDLDLDAGLVDGPPGGNNQAASACQSCGKPLTDSFDQALGMCDDCRTKKAGPTPGSAEPAAESAALPDILPELDRKEEPDVALAAPPRPSSVSRPKVQKVSEPRLSMEPVRLTSPPRKLNVPVVLGLLLGMAIAAWAVYTKPWHHKAPPLAMKVAAPRARALETAISVWKKKWGTVGGKSSAHTLVGEEFLSQDTPIAYRQAQEEFQKALILDSDNDRALGGLVLALAFGKGDPIDEATAKSYEQMLADSEARSFDARVFVAHAHFYLSRDMFINDVLVMAERAKQSSNQRDKALAQLAIGHYNLAKNPKYAEAAFSDAEKLDPKLKRAFVYHARLRVALGRFKAAVQGLEARIKDDPDHWEAAEFLVRLHLDGGEVGLAKEVLKSVASRAKEPATAQLALAKLLYQSDNKLDGAADALNGLTAHLEKLTVALASDVFAHLACVKRLQGDLEAALSAVHKALDANPANVNAHLQKLLVLLKKADAKGARAEWTELEGKLDNPGLEFVLEGRVFLLEDNAAEAMRSFASSLEKDARRTDARFLMGLAALKGKALSRAWEAVLREGLQIDPFQFGPQGTLADIYIRPGELMEVARGEFQKLKLESDDPNRPTAEGLLAYYSQDWASAETYFSKLLAIDGTNGNGFTFRSLLALRRKDITTAHKMAKKAVEADRQNALAHLALAMSEMGVSKVDAAKVELEKALELVPTMLSAKTKLAQYELSQKPDSDAARDMLVGVLAVDSMYTEARRALYAMPP